MRAQSLKSLPMFLRRGHRIDRAGASGAPGYGPTHDCAYNDEEFEVLERGSLGAETTGSWDGAFERELTVVPDVSTDEPATELDLRGTIRP